MHQGKLTQPVLPHDTHLISNVQTYFFYVTEEMKAVLFINSGNFEDRLFGQFWLISPNFGRLWSVWQVFGKLEWMIDFFVIFDDFGRFEWIQVDSGQFMVNL